MQHGDCDLEELEAGVARDARGGRGDVDEGHGVVDEGHGVVDDAVDGGDVLELVLAKCTVAGIEGSYVFEGREPYDAVVMGVFFFVYQACAERDEDDALWDALSLVQESDDITRELRSTRQSIRYSSFEVYSRRG